MDYIKEPNHQVFKCKLTGGFNPCCDGLYKRTQTKTKTNKNKNKVSILVVMDYIKEHRKTNYPK